MKLALYDRSDDKIVATFNDGDTTLEAAVTAYLKSTGDWQAEGYYGDGRLTFTGAEFVQRHLYEEDDGFWLLTLPEPLDSTHDS